MVRGNTLVKLPDINCSQLQQLGLVKMHEHKER